MSSQHLTHTNTPAQKVQVTDPPLPQLDPEPMLLMRSPYGVRGRVAARHEQAVTRLGWTRVSAESEAER